MGGPMPIHFFIFSLPYRYFIYLLNVQTAWVMYNPFGIYFSSKAYMRRNINKRWWLLLVLLILVLGLYLFMKPKKVEVHYRPVQVTKDDIQSTVLSTGVV